MSLIKCSECGQEISTEAEVCPHCGKPNLPVVSKGEQDDGNAVSKAVKFIVFIILLWLLLLFLIPKFESFFTKKNPLGNLTPTQNQQVVAQKATPKAPETIIKKVGDSYILGNMEYQVLLAKDMGSKWGYDKTTGKYVALKIKATNIGKTESGVSKIYIQDKLGRKYELNILVNGSPFDDKNPFYGLNPYGITSNWGKISAGFSETFVAVFEVPNDSVGLELKYPSTQGTVILSVTLGL